MWIALPFSLMFASARRPMISYSSHFSRIALVFKSLNFVAFHCAQSFSNCSSASQRFSRIISISFTSSTLAKLYSDLPSVTKNLLYISASRSILLKFCSSIFSSSMYDDMKSLLYVTSFSSVSGSRMRSVSRSNCGMDDFSSLAYSLSCDELRLLFIVSHFILSCIFFELMPSMVFTSSAVIFSKFLLLSSIAMFRYELSLRSLMSYHISRTSFACVFSKNAFSSMISPSIFFNMSSNQRSISAVRFFSSSG